MAGGRMTGRQAMNEITRRDFLKTSLAGAVAATFGGSVLAEEPAGSEVIVVHGADAAAMLAAGVERLGGWSAFVKKGKKVTLKVNAAWANPPEHGSNTSPELVEACVKACLGAGAGEVVLPENPCSPPEQAFEMSGIARAVKSAGGRMISLRDDRLFKHVELPGAKTLKQADVAVDVLETACLINMPVAKHHGSAGLSLSMKNWMGSIKDRGFWHSKGLHQCIADFSTLVRPNLVIIDALRIMLDSGPRGPGKLEHPGLLILSRDPVAADAYSATLFRKEPSDIHHIRLAGEMNIGCADVSRIKVTRLDV